MIYFLVCIVRMALNSPGCLDRRLWIVIACTRSSLEAALLCCSSGTYFVLSLQDAAWVGGGVDGWPGQKPTQSVP